MKLVRCTGVPLRTSCPLADMANAPGPGAVHSLLEASQLSSGWKWPSPSSVELRLCSGMEKIQLLASEETRNSILMHSKILGGSGKKINPHLQKWCTCCGAVPDPQIRGFTDMRHICIVSLYTFQTESRQKKAGLKQI